MRRVLPFLLLIACAVLAGAQTTTIIANNISSFGGSPVTGIFCVSPVNQSGQPINLVTPGGQQLSSRIPLCFAITAGVLSSAVVPDTSQTQPLNACLKATIYNSSGAQVGNTYPCIQPSGETWSFDAYVPTSLSLIPNLQLPQFYTNNELNQAQWRLNLLAGTNIALSNSQGNVTISCPGCGGSGGGSNNENLSYSATPTFSTALATSRIALSGNITTFTLGAGGDGQSKCLLFVHDGTGSTYMVNPPVNVVGFMNVGNTASKRSFQCFNYFQTDSLWMANSPGVINQ
jgi:hypothetical protein